MKKLYFPISAQPALDSEIGGIQKESWILKRNQDFFSRNIWNEKFKTSTEERKKGSASNLAVLSLDGDSNKENNCDDLELNFIVENMRFLSEKIVSFLTFMFVRDEDLLDKKPWVTFYSVLGVSAYH